MCKNKTIKRYCAGPYECVIVGGGLSGLCCGALLARIKPGK
jgi:L-2-hydroxyglutarate oxidase LhgO